MEQPKSWRATFSLLLSWKMAAMAAMGFSSGLPFYIIKDVLKAQMTEAQVSIETIGLSSALALPYTLKFLWSPPMDAYAPLGLGRRRGWIILAQVLLLGAIATLGLPSPESSLELLALAALAVSFFGATQDIALDAFRREFLKDEELGFGTGLWMNTWRLGMLVAVGGAFLSSDLGLDYRSIYLLLSLLMFVGIVTALLVPEPRVGVAPPTSLRESVVSPFVEFFQRPLALWILLFILFYKLGDSVAQTMAIPYLLGQGYSKSEYFVVVKGVGMVSLFGGVLLGGVLMARLGIGKCLWIFGLLQALSTALFSLIVLVRHEEDQGLRLGLLSGIVGFEFLSAGLGQAAYASYMAMQTNKRFTATQYSLLSSLMAVPATVVGASAGHMVAHLGWVGFYTVCALLAIPGMAILVKLLPGRGDKA